MSNEVKTQAGPAAATLEKRQEARKVPQEIGILVILVGIAVPFEIAGWIVKGDSFLMNPQRLFIILLQASIIGLLAIAVTQVIITGGIDLSSGSVLAISAMVAASFAQTPENTRAVYPALINLPFIIPLAAGYASGFLRG
jgi:inositol transport system permease protein